MFLADCQRVNEETISPSLSLVFRLWFSVDLSRPSLPSSLRVRDEWLTEEWRKYPAARFLSSCNAIHTGVSVSLRCVCVCVCCACLQRYMSKCNCTCLPMCDTQKSGLVSWLMFVSDKHCFAALCFFVRAMPSWRYTRTHAHTHRHTCLHTVMYVCIYSHPFDNWACQLLYNPLR